MRTNLRDVAKSAVKFFLDRFSYPQGFNVRGVDEALRIREHLGRDPEIIVELGLGTGSGHLAYVCRKMFPKCTYVILDLPEALMRANVFLRKALPGEAVDYGVARMMPAFDRSTLRQGRVWLLGTQHIERLAESSADAFVNVFGLAEVPPDATCNYLKQIDRVTAGVFLLNRVGGIVAPTRWREIYRNGEARVYAVPAVAEAPSSGA